MVEIVPSHRDTGNDAKCGIAEHEYTQVSFSALSVATVQWGGHHHICKVIKAINVYLLYCLISGNK